MKIKVKLLNPKCAPKINPNGEWIDLRSAITTKYHYPQVGNQRVVKANNTEFKYRDIKFDMVLIPLGIAMQIPKGYEAIIAPRSSTYKSWGIVLANSIGIIDSSYCADTDEWKFPALIYRNEIVNEGDRICQFRIQLSQKATWWQKLKWLFDSKIEFEFVDSLNNPARGGFGTTGRK